MGFKICRKKNNNLLFLISIIFLSFSNFNMVFACEKWVIDFANDYCSDLQGPYNPLKKFEKLKKKYTNFIVHKSSKNVDKEINSILIKNIRETCKDKKHLLLRIIK